MDSFVISKIRYQVLFVRHIWHDLFSPATFYQQYNISPGIRNAMTRSGRAGEYLLAFVCYTGCVVWDQFKVSRIQYLVSLRRLEAKINTA